MESRSLNIQQVGPEESAAGLFPKGYQPLLFRALNRGRGLHGVRATTLGWWRERPSRAAASRDVSDLQARSRDRRTSSTLHQDLQASGQPWPGGGGGVRDGRNCRLRRPLRVRRVTIARLSRGGPPGARAVPGYPAQNVPCSSNYNLGKTSVKIRIARVCKPLLHCLRAGSTSQRSKRPQRLNVSTCQLSQQATWTSTGSDPARVHPSTRRVAASTVRARQHRATSSISSPYPGSSNMLHNASGSFGIWSTCAFTWPRCERTAGGGRRLDVGVELPGPQV